MIDLVEVFAGQDCKGLELPPNYFSISKLTDEIQKIHSPFALRKIFADHFSLNFSRTISFNLRFLLHSP